MQVFNFFKGCQEKILHSNCICLIKYMMNVIVFVVTELLVLEEWNSNETVINICTIDS